MQARVVTVGALESAAANNICLSQTPLGAGNLTIAGSLASGGVATIDKPRRVLFTPAGAEATNVTVWTVYGTDWNGSIISETVAGVNNPSTVYTVYDYKTVTRIAVNKAQAGAVTVGTNGIASSSPINLDSYGLAPTSLQVTVSGTVSYTVQQTLDDLNAVGYVNATWVNHPDTNLVAATSTAQGNYAYVPQWVRITLNSGTGSVVLTVVQAGTVPF